MVVGLKPEPFSDSLVKRELATLGELQRRVVDYISMEESALAKNILTKNDKGKAFSLNPPTKKEGKESRVGRMSMGDFTPLIV